METEYHTEGGSTYVHTHDNGFELWEKRTFDGKIIPIDKGFCIPKKNLVPLLERYKGKALDQTYCLDEDYEGNFLEDTLFESTVFSEFEKSSKKVILFITTLDNGKYQINFSRDITRTVEKWA